MRELFVFFSGILLPLSSPTVGKTAIASENSSFLTGAPFNGLLCAVKLGTQKERGLDDRDKDTTD